MQILSNVISTIGSIIMALIFIIFAITTMTIYAIIFPIAVLYDIYRNIIHKE
jgi:hypothetical protein